MQGETPHLPNWIGWVMAKKGNHTLPDVGIMLASREVRHRRATDTEKVGRAGSCTEEEEPRGLQILHSWNAVEQQTVGINSRQELHPDEFIRTQWGAEDADASLFRSIFQIAKPELRVGHACNFKQCGVAR